MCRPAWSRWISLGLVIVNALAGVATAATFTPLTTNGPAANRIAIVFFAEGYTNGQQALFLGDCTNARSAILSEEPFTEYSNYFHFYAVFTNSAQTGSDHPLTAVTRNTSFNSTYDGTLDYVITIPGTNWSNGVLPLLNTFTPTNTHRFRLPVLLVNDITKGGSANTNLAITSTSPAAYNSANGGILTHELGHLFAALDDEYDSTGGLDVSGLPAGPNTTQQTNRATIPWTLWISTNTPVPTDAQDPEFFGEVGLFEGAHYTTTNWYRPRVNCRMRSVSSGVPFCEVCREALLRSCYLPLRTFDSFTPTNATLTLPVGGSTNFTITPLSPATHALRVQWQTNGVNVPDATNTTYTLNLGTLPNGVHTLRAVVRDDTDWVRNDPGPLADTNVWTLTVAVPALWIESPQSLANGFRLTVRGTNVSTATVQGTTNFTTWTSLATNSLTGGAWAYTNATTLPWRFYRVVAPPQ
jgi:hypothetical protein